MSLVTSSGLSDWNTLKEKAPVIVNLSTISRFFQYSSTKSWDPSEVKVLINI